MLDLSINGHGLGLYFFLIVLMIVLVGAHILFKAMPRISSNTESIRHRDSAGRFFCG